MDLTPFKLFCFHICLFSLKFVRKKELPTFIVERQKNNLKSKGKYVFWQPSNFLTSIPKY